MTKAAARLAAALFVDAVRTLLFVFAVHGTLQSLGGFERRHSGRGDFDGLLGLGICPGAGSTLAGLESAEAIYGNPVAIGHVLGDVCETGGDGAFGVSVGDIQFLGNMLGDIRFGELSHFFQPSLFLLPCFLLFTVYCYYTIDGIKNKAR